MDQTKKYALVELQTDGRIRPLTTDQSQLLITTLELAGLQPLPVIHHHLPHPDEAAYFYHQKTR